MKIKRLGRWFRRDADDLVFVISPDEAKILYHFIVERKYGIASIQKWEDLNGAEFHLIIEANNNIHGAFHIDGFPFDFANYSDHIELEIDMDKILKGEKE